MAALRYANGQFSSSGNKNDIMGWKDFELWGGKMGIDFSAVFKHSLDVTAIEVFNEEIVKGTRFPKVVKCIKEVIFITRILTGNGY
ncbi:hypothetical protein [Paenibacillus sp. PL91]|uniref:hypothetical protein n=1 Tax=Paenibacillus sp. PL91 TaxID=2729538 RepID=UPI00145CBE3B|nr:hypothetical protein [Paenibacillus sp. PL91]MBC9204196.1 hypothetical protein [Paenibacillus sp. PL91]